MYRSRNDPRHVPRRHDSPRLTAPGAIDSCDPDAVDHKALETDLSGRSNTPARFCTGPVSWSGTYDRLRLWEELLLVLYPSFSIMLISSKGTEIDACGPRPSANGVGPQLW